MINSDFSLNNLLNSKPFGKGEKMIDFMPILS